MKKIIILLLSLVLLSSCVTMVDERQKVEVSGTAVVKFEPDIASFNIQIREEALTTIEASAKANEKMAQVEKVLDDFEIEKIETSALSLYPTREYNNNNDTYTEVQRATNSITVWTKELDSISKIIDSLSVISDISINNIELDKLDKEEIYNQARKLAFSQALNKAKIYVMHS